MTDHASLFEPARFGNLQLRNRVVMAPLTRGRADRETRVPNDLMREYYTQRASAGLIIAEATAISAQGYGWYGAPAMYTDAHQEGWHAVVDSVHKAGGTMVLQLWHMGRVSHPDFQNGALPVAPSALAAEGFAHTPTGKKPYVVPRALDVSELKGIAQDYKNGARRAIDAGFDGVEIHMANSYLLDQFIRDGSNKRDDQYGGTIENRLRFPLEVLDAVATEVGADRTGIRISPTNPYNGMKDSNPIKHFTRFAGILNNADLAYLHVMEPITAGPRSDMTAERVTPYIRDVYKGHLIANGGYDDKTGQEALQTGAADAIAFGVPFLSNPDLVERFHQGAPLNTPDQETFYFGGAEGYIDYPTLQHSKAA